MKVQNVLRPANAAASQAVHKTVQGWSHSAKVAGHRYERRKIREWLRQGGAEETVALTSPEPFSS